LAEQSLTYIDVRFNTAGDTALDEATVDGDEFTLSGTALGDGDVALDDQERPGSATAPTASTTTTTAR